MKISTRGRYALRLMLDLAEHEEEDVYISLQEIAKRQGISKKYLEQIVPMFNQSGMLRANRGYQGGYRLARKAEEYTIGEILRVTEGDLACVDCVAPNGEKCPREEGCPTQKVWAGLYDAVITYLNGITLADVLKKQKV